MILNKNSGDDLARAFQNILNQQKLNKTAEDHSENDGADMSCATDDNQENNADCATDDQNNEASDMEGYLDSMMDDGKEEDHAADEMTNMMADMESHMDEDYMMDAHAQKIMTGLGKIAGSLKRKGEKFAADVVEATAISIRNDIVSKAKEKTAVLNELDKMASDLLSKGNRAAAAEVVKTASNIAKS